MSLSPGREVSPLLGCEDGGLGIVVSQGHPATVVLMVAFTLQLVI